MSTPPANVLELTYLELGQLGPHPDNVRKNLGDLAELAKSIDGTGILEPLLVLPPNDEGVHLVVAGHRRLAAAHKAASVTAVPCVIRDLDPAEVVEAMLVENLQRAEISPVEEAQGYARLVELGTTVAQIAKKVGRTAAHVKGRLALTTLPAPLLRLIEDGTLTLAKAAEIAAHADDPDAMDWITNDVAGMKAHEWEWYNPGSRLARYTRDRDEKAALDAEHEKLTRAGILRFDPPRGWWMPSHLDLSKPCKVEHLELDKDDRRAHAKEPCHQVFLEIKDPKAAELKVTRIPMCVEPRRHTTAADEADRSPLQIPVHDLAGDDDDQDDAGDEAMPGAHLGGGAGAAERAAEFAAAEQRRKAAAEAETARRAFEKTWIKTAPLDLPEFLAFDLMSEIDRVSEVDDVGGWVLGVDPHEEDAGYAIGEAYDTALTSSPDTWAPWIWASRIQWAEATAHYRDNGLFVALLRHLDDEGYELSDYEAEVIAEHRAAQEAARQAAATPDVDAMELSDEATELLTLWGTWLASSTGEWAAGADTVPDDVLEDLKLRGLAEFVPPAGPLGIGTVKPTDLGRAVCAVLAERQDATET